jgi:hypothetical protein
LFIFLTKTFIFVRQSEIRNPDSAEAEATKRKLHLSLSLEQNFSAVSHYLRRLPLSPAVSQSLPSSLTLFVVSLSGSISFSLACSLFRFQISNHWCCDFKLIGFDSAILHHSHFNDFCSQGTSKHSRIGFRIVSSGILLRSFKFFFGFHYIFLCLLLVWKGFLRYASLVSPSLKNGVWESMVCLFLKIKENILLFIPHYLKNGYIDLWISCDLSAGKKPWNIFIGFVILLSFYRFCLLATNFLVYLLTCTLLIQLLAYCIDNFFVWIF